MHFRYQLVAAASSGDAGLLARLLEWTDRQLLKQQLPAALISAGRRGHLAALQLLLDVPVVSSRPLQVCRLGFHVNVLHLSLRVCGAGSASTAV